MPKKIDLTGQHFGKWTVLKESDKRNAGGCVKWTCQCECGTVKDVDGASLRSGKSISCGCYRPNKKQGHLINQKFGMLTVIEETTNRDSNGSIIWKCKCDCGNICFRSTTTLHKKENHSCGCFNKTTCLDLSILGKEFGELTVLEYDGKSMFKCQCSCGNIKSIRRDSLISGNTNSCGCINYSIGEKNIEDILKQNNIIYKAQYTTSELGKKRFDFAIFKDNDIIRLIEFDGEQHFNDKSGLWNSKDSLSDIQQRDQEKNKWAKEHNIPLIRIPFWERDNITLETIMGDKYLI